MTIEELNELAFEVGKWKALRQQVEENYFKARSELRTLEARLVETILPLIDEIIKLKIENDKLSAMLDILQIEEGEK